MNTAVAMDSYHGRAHGNPAWETDRETKSMQYKQYSRSRVSLSAQWSINFRGKTQTGLKNHVVYENRWGRSHMTLLSGSLLLLSMKWWCFIFVIFLFLCKILLMFSSSSSCTLFSFFTTSSIPCLPVKWQQEGSRRTSYEEQDDDGALMCQTRNQRIVRW